MDQSTSRAARIIAYYLPQFHPIPENDEWWGKGFTEWTNVAKARPLFPGHYQPHLPADLGFYDLRVPETRIAQAELARTHGIEGFMYWHYWFAGRRILERPFNEVLNSGEPNFPFCLGWANQSWTGVWHGAPNRVLLEQTYPGLADYEAHFYTVLDAFVDERYLTVEGKPVFLVFCPFDLPDSQVFTDCWRELAHRAGFKGLYLLGIADPSLVRSDSGFDGFVIDNPIAGVNRLKAHMDGIFSRIYWRILRRNLRLDFYAARKYLRKGLQIYAYSEYIKHALSLSDLTCDQYPCVVPNWDNTPRSQNRGRVIQGSTPELFGIHLGEAVNSLGSKIFDKRLVFIKSWNEWAEGNYLEPDQRFGRRYLEVVRDLIGTSIEQNLGDMKDFWGRV